jgi:hypothetical protein
MPCWGRSAERDALGAFGSTPTSGHAIAHLNGRTIAMLKSATSRVVAGRLQAARGMTLGMGERDAFHPEAIPAAVCPNKR